VLPTISTSLGVARGDPTLSTKHGDCFSIFFKDQEMASLATVFYTLPKFLKNKQLVTEFRAPISDQRVIEELKKACAQIGFSDIVLC